MGFYLNPTDILELYRKETIKPYFVDKTEMLKELILVLKQGGSNISVTRPRRFGKSVAAAMIGSFFCGGVDGESLFSGLKIGESKEYKKYMNQYNVIYIDFSKGPRNCKSYEQYIEYFEKRFVRDIKKAYPDVIFDDSDSMGEILRTVSMEHDNEKFILVFDEWDYVFHRKYFSEENRGEFTAFLGDLTKGRAYALMTYMTGVLPIKKYSASDTMNHFDEYNMANSLRFSEYFGFTGAEVDELYRRYLNNTPEPLLSRMDLEQWYDGYHNERKMSMYNPNSVVTALTENQPGNYWAKAGEYDELADYVLDDTDGVRDAVMLLVAGEPIAVDISEYASTAPVLKHRDEILSVMTVYGYLNYYEGCVRIPNRELQTEFEKIIRMEPKFDYMRRLEKESMRILKATYEGDVDTISSVLAFVHNSESPLKAYNDEAELSGSVKLAYIAARNRYDMQREDQAGTGYVDYIFYPYNRADDGIILELKCDDSPENALKQIRNKKYAMKFQGKLGEESKTTGRILAVGIGYYRKDKVHRCKIEVM
ncbi:MAG: ATP-binding protein [Lachnospiraceae bacterium]|nr:ATP-binding protein [Lachnospiraceae bacterium]